MVGRDSSERIQAVRRVAFIGKGGAGKSFIAGTVARLLARRGDNVLALDIDTMPGTALTLGLPTRPQGLPASLGEERMKQGWVTCSPR